MRDNLPYLTACYLVLGGMGLLAVASNRRAEPSRSPPHPETRIPSPPPRHDPRSGNRLVEAAQAALWARKSVAARVRFRVRMFACDLAGSGTYLQSGTGDDQRFRWELRMQVAGTTSTLVQVYDGRFLWTDRILPSGPRITRLDLHQKRRDSGSSTTRPADPPVGSVLPFVAGCPYQSGLARLLGSLLEHYQFSESRQSVLLDVPVYVVDGQLKPEAGSPSVPEPEPAGESNSRNSQTMGGTDTSDEPENQGRRNLPEQVRLVLGLDDLFPYRLVYGTTQDHATQEAIPGNWVLRIEWHEVQLDGQVDERRFHYAPPTPDWINITDQPTLFHGFTR